MTEAQLIHDCLIAPKDKAPIRGTVEVRHDVDRADCIQVEYVGAYAIVRVDEFMKALKALDDRD